MSSGHTKQTPDNQKLSVNHKQVCRNQQSSTLIAASKAAFGPRSKQVTCHSHLSLMMPRFIWIKPLPVRLVCSYDRWPRRQFLRPHRNQGVQKLYSHGWSCRPKGIMLPHCQDWVIWPGEKEECWTPSSDDSLTGPPENSSTLSFQLYILQWGLTISVKPEEDCLNGSGPGHDCMLRGWHTCSITESASALSIITCSSLIEFFAAAIILRPVSCRADPLNCATWSIT